MGPVSQQIIQVEVHPGALSKRADDLSTNAPGRYSSFLDVKPARGVVQRKMEWKKLLPMVRRRIGHW
jgi:hypothetical protein